MDWTLPVGIVKRIRGSRSYADSHAYRDRAHAGKPSAPRALLPGHDGIYACVDGKRCAGVGQVWRLCQRCLECRHGKRREGMPGHCR